MCAPEAWEKIWRYYYHFSFFHLLCLCLSSVIVCCNHSGKSAFQRQGMLIKIKAKLWLPKNIPFWLWSNVPPVILFLTNILVCFHLRAQGGDRHGLFATDVYKLVTDVFLCRWLLTHFDKDTFFGENHKWPLIFTCADRMATTFTAVSEQWPPPSACYLLIKRQLHLLNRLYCFGRKSQSLSFGRPNINSRM